MTRSTASLSLAAAPHENAPIDLALVAQRILKLAEISVLEHLESLDRSQAVGLSDMLDTHEDETGSAER
jgi:hypothetical protein